MVAKKNPNAGAKFVLEGWWQTDRAGAPSRRRGRGATEEHAEPTVVGEHAPQGATKATAATRRVRRREFDTSLLGLLLVGTMLAVATPASATKCAIPTPEEAFRRAKLVFVATVASVSPGNPHQQHSAVLELQQSYKGSPPPKLTVHGGGLKGFSLQQGRQAVFFTSAGPEPLIHICSGTRYIDGKTSDAQPIDLRVLGPRAAVQPGPGAGQPATAPPALAAVQPPVPGSTTHRGGCAACALGAGPGKLPDGFAFIIILLGLLSRRRGR